MSRSRQSPKSRRKVQEEEASALPWLLLSAAILAGIAWGATRITVGDKSVWRHAQALFSWARPGTDALPSPAATPAVREALSRPAAGASDGEPLSGEYTSEEKAALEALLPP